MTPKNRRIASVAIFAVAIASFAWWLGSPPAIPEDAVRRGPRFWGARVELHEAGIAVVTLAAATLGSIVAAAAVWRPRTGLLLLYGLALSVALTGALALLKLGWWPRARQSSMADYALDPWIALGCAWMLVAGLIMVRRRSGAASTGVS